MAHDSTDRIVAALCTWIASAPAGTQLPSSRRISAEHGASPVTVQKALHRLTAQGLIDARPGVGTFVRGSRMRPPADFGWQTAALGAPQGRHPDLSVTQRPGAPDAIALHSGYPASELLPGGLVRAALARAARSDAAVRRAPADGLAELREWFAAELATVTAPEVSPVSARDVVIVPGSQSGLASVFRAAVGEGRPVVVESPTYWGAMVAAAQAGVTLVPVASGPEGPDPDDVDRALASSGARAFYAQPTFANPHGAQWTDERARAVLEVVRRRGAFLIEDDWAHDLAIDSDPSPLARLDQDGHVIYIRSLTKSVSPALRVAAVIARGPARERIAADRTADAMYVSGVLQAAALDVVTQPAWRRHLRAQRSALRVRRDALLGGIRQHLPQCTVALVPAGGLNLWVRLPDGTDVATLVRAAAARDVLIAHGREWFPAETPGPYVRLNYAGPSPERYDEAMRLVAEALAEQG